MTFPLRVIIQLTAILFVLKGTAQKENLKQAYGKYSIVGGIQFQNFAIPFRDIGSNFTHPGFFVGTEFGYNEKRTLIQQVTIGGYLNSEIGNGIHVATQLGFRPRVYNKIHAELKVGFSFLRVFHPTQAYEFENDQWNETTGGKSQLTLPVDVGLTYFFNTSLGELSPFLTYQISPALFYNETLPLNIYTNFIAGLRIRLKKQES